MDDSRPAKRRRLPQEVEEAPSDRALHCGELDHADEVHLHQYGGSVEDIGPGGSGGSESDADCDSDIEMEAEDDEGKEAVLHEFTRLLQQAHDAALEQE